MDKQIIRGEQIGSNPITHIQILYVSLLNAQCGDLNPNVLRFRTLID